MASDAGASPGVPCSAASTSTMPMSARLRTCRQAHTHKQQLVKLQRYCWELDALFYSDRRPHQFGTVFYQPHRTAHLPVWPPPHITTAASNLRCPAPSPWACCRSQRTGPWKRAPWLQASWWGPGLQAPGTGTAACTWRRRPTWEGAGQGGRMECERAGTDHSMCRQRTIQHNRSLQPSYAALSSPTPAL